METGPELFRSMETGTEQHGKYGTGTRTPEQEQGQYETNTPKTKVHTAIFRQTGKTPQNNKPKEIKAASCRQQHNCV
jgi:hypothetical protein